MKRRFYILLIMPFLSCGGNALELYPEARSFRSIYCMAKNNVPEAGYINYNSPVFNDSIIKFLAGPTNLDSQYMYFIHQPKMNLNKMLKYGNPQKIQDFTDQPKDIDYWTDPNILRLYFSDQLNSFEFYSHDNYFLIGHKPTPRCDYLFYQRAGVCVGWEYCCLSIDKKGNIVDNIWLTWDWGYDGHYHTAVLEKSNDSTYIQTDQHGDDYTNPKKGQFWQYDITKREIIFHTNGKIDTKYLESDSIPKPAKKIGGSL